MGTRLPQDLIDKILAQADMIDGRPVQKAPPPPVVEGMSEKEFQAEVERIARSHGWRVYHTRDSRKSAHGFPDIVALRGSREVIAELKVGGNRPDAAQESWLEAYRDAGREVFVWRPSDLPEIERVFLEAP